MRHALHTIAVFILTMTLHAQDSWQSLNGPYGGTPIAFGADSSGNLFVSTRTQSAALGNNQSFGVYRSTDHGGTWAKVFAVQDFSYGFYTTPAGSIFLATVAGGYRSDDNGTTWTLKYTHNVRAFSYNPVTATLFAAGLGATAPEVYKSTDNGENWTYVSIGTPINNRRMVISKTGHMYLSGNSGVYRSTDNGATWKAINTGLTSLAVRSLHMTTNDSVFAGTSSGVFRLNSGTDTSWTNINGGVIPSGKSIFALTSSGNTILLGTMGGGLYRSLDNGNTWAAVSGLPTQNITAVMFDRGNRYFLGLNQWGIYQSNSSGSGGSWFSTNQGYSANATLKLAVNTIGYIFSGADCGGLTRSTDNGTSWTSLTFAEKPTATAAGIYPDGVTFLFNNPRNNDLYAQVSDFSPVVDSLRKSTDYGNTWKAVTSLPEAHYVGIDSTSNHLIAFWDSLSDQTYGRIYHSSDNGVSWTTVFSVNEVFSAHAVAANGNIFAGSNGGVYRSTDDGANWSPVSSGLTTITVTALAINTAGNLFAGTSGGGIFRSTNNGSSWQVTSLTNGSIAAIEKIPGGNMVATTTDRGALYSADGMTWSYLNTGITSISDKGLAVRSDGTAFLGTSGEGVFKRTLFSTFSSIPFLSHNTGIVKTSIARAGTIGYVDDNSTAGEGFQLNGENYLSTAGVIMGTGPSKVSRHLFKANSFKLSSDSTFSVNAAGTITHEQGYVNYVDSLAPSPMGIRVEQESYADNVAGHNGFVIFKYRIRNLNATAISNFNMGLFSAWNLDPGGFSAQFGRCDSVRRLIYVENNSTTPTRLFGTKILNKGSSAYYQVNSVAHQSTALAWNEISGASQSASIDNTVSNQALSSGSFTIPANGYIVLGYAILGGINTSELLTRADSAQALWSRIATPAITKDVSQLTYSNIPVGNSSAKTFRITNSGDDTLTITGISITDTLFKCILPQSILLPPSRDTLLSVAFRPNAPVAFDDTLTVTGNRSTTLRLIGNGIAPSVFLPAAYNFNEKKLGTPDTVRIKLKNAGNGPLTVTNMTVAPDTVFKIQSAKSLSLIAGDSALITVTFTPLAEVTYVDTMKILSSNAPVTPIVLSGTGTTLVVGFNPVIVGTTATAGSNVNVRIKPSAFLGAGDYARLFFKAGGDAQYDSLPMAVNLADTSYSASIPQAILGSRGTAYYIKMNFNGIQRSAPSVNPSGAPYTLQIELPQGVKAAQDQPTGNKITSYRLISYPIMMTDPGADSVLKNFGKGGKDWSLYRWQNGVNVVYTDPSFQEFSPGRGYWFITKTADKLKSAAGTTTSIAQNFSIDLQPGYNMIGNPFDFGVAWSDVTKTADVGNLWTLDVSSGQVDYVLATGLKPFEGYWVKNNNASSLATITIPPKETVLPKEAGYQGKTAALQQGEWRVKITAAGKWAADQYNFIGMLQDASDDYDANDLSESPRQPVEFVKLYFPHPDWRGNADDYGMDYRRVNPDGQYWDLEVSTNTDLAQIPLGFEGLETIPASFQIVLIDKELNIAVNMREQSVYNVASGNGKELKRHFRFVAGSDAFVAENNLSVSGLPKNFELSQNFPNPFNPTTTFKYGLPVRAKVDIIVYNILGQPVRNLLHGEQPAGYHVLLWDGKNDQRQQVASGVYFYRIVAQSVAGQKNYVKTQKMVLVK